MDDRPLGPISAAGAPQRRTALRGAVEDLLLLAGCLFELRDGATASARARVAQWLDRVLGDRLDPDAAMNAMIADGLAGESDFWRACCVPTGQRLVAELCGEPTARPPDFQALPARRFEVSFRRTFDLSRAPARRLRMPAPVEDAHLTDLRVEVEEGRGEVSVGPGRIEVKPAASERGAFVLAARYSFLAHAGLPHGAGLEDAETWLAPREGPIQVTPAVAALAERLAGRHRAAVDQVMAFRDHLIDTMACGRVALDALGDTPAPDWILANRWFDCRLGAALLAAMCRARGLPARLVGGYLLWQAPSEHYWMEAWLPGQGWTPFDLLAWDLSAGGRDAAWRGVYAGAIDYRMKTQVFPNVFTGAVGVAMDGAWHRLSRRGDGGTETRLVSIPGGELIYADEIRVVRD